MAGAAKRLVIVSAVDPTIIVKKDVTAAGGALLSLADIENKQANTQASLKINAIPPVIIGTYTIDYDILYIDSVIRRKLNTEKPGLEGLQEKLEREERRIRGEQNRLERLTSKKEIERLKKQIQALVSGSEYEKYYDEVKSILAEYKELGPYVERKTFTDTADQEYVRKDDKVNKRLDLIRQYIVIAKKYHTIDVTREVKTNNNCTHCNYSLQDVYINDVGMQTCPQCKAESFVYTFQLLADRSGQNGSSSTVVKADYDSSENFLKVIRRYQGKQPNKLPSALFVDLDQYFTNNHTGLTKEQASKVPLNAKGRKEGTDLKTMTRALVDMKYSALYEDIYLICQQYWGWKLPDISHLEEKIIGHYIRTEQVYNQLEKSRTSSLGTQYRLFKHLQLVGHDCSVDDFKISGMIDSRELHDDLWKRMVQGSNDPEIYFIPTM